MKIESGGNGDICFTSYHDDYCNRNLPRNRPTRQEILSESEQRHLISWFLKNRAEMVREIVCEECPEHLCQN